MRQRPDSGGACQGAGRLLGCVCSRRIRSGFRRPYRDAGSQSDWKPQRNHQARLPSPVHHRALCFNAGQWDRPKLGDAEVEIPNHIVIDTVRRTAVWYSFELETGSPRAVETIGF